VELIISFRRWLRIGCAVAKTSSKTITKRPTGKAPVKTQKRAGGTPSVPTKYNKPKSVAPTAIYKPVTPVKTQRTLPPTAIYKPQSTLKAGPSTPQITPTMGGGGAKKTAAPIVKKAIAPVPANVKTAVAPIPSQAQARAAQLASQIAAAARQQQANRGTVGAVANTGGGAATPGTPPVAPPPPTRPPVTPPTPVLPPSVGTPGGGTGFNTTARAGVGTAGQYNRRRLNRGPRTGMSTTPEMLRRIAQQRIGPT
jgi:hypothetical protein